MTATRKHLLGLTLIELLVALVILAVIGIMSWRGIDGALRSREQIRSVEQRWQKLSRGFALIEHNLLQAADRGTVLPGSFSDFTLEKLPGERQRLVFWRMDPEQGSRLTGFRLDDDKLMLLRWPHNVPLAANSSSSSSASSVFSVSTFGKTSATDDQDVDAESILDGVRNVRWAVLSSSMQWLDTWPPVANAGLPYGVRLDMDIDNVGHIQRLFALR
jgi:type II secretory pathway component PulJ